MRSPGPKPRPPNDAFGGYCDWTRLDEFGTEFAPDTGFSALTVVKTPPLATDGLLQNLWFGAWAALGGAGAASGQSQNYEVCAPNTNVFPQQVPLLAGEPQRKAYNNALEFEVTSGQFRDGPYVKKLAPGIYSEIKVSPALLKGDAADKAAAAPVCLPKENVNVPTLYHRTNPPYSEWHDIDTPSRAKAAWPPKTITGAASHLVNLAFKGIFPPKILEAATIRGDIELFRGDVYTVKEAQFHRDELSEIDSLGIPVGQLFVFMGEDPSQPAYSLRTEWMFDPELRQMWHSGPIAEGFEEQNGLLRRFTVYAPREIVEDAFPGLVIPEIKSLFRPTLDPSELGRLRWAGGGDKYNLDPGEIVVQAANALPSSS